MPRPLRVLLSEASSLTAREHVTVLGRSGVRIEAMSSDPLALCRWSRWVRRLHRCPPVDDDPAGYLDAVRAALANGEFDALLPTHEQAWLFSVARDRLPPGTPVALAPADTFARLQSKLAFAELLDELGLPQPAWRAVPTGRAGAAGTAASDDGAGQVDGAAAVLDELPYPYFLKSAFGTAGQGVRLVRNLADRTAAVADLARSGDLLMAQMPAPGQYGQVQALCEHGRMVAVHTSVQTGQGVGGSAAARLSVAHPHAADAVATVAAALSWHGGLTLDYFHQDGIPLFIECNPRTVEPANAVAAGVDLPRLSIDLARGRPLPTHPLVGRAGVRTRGAIALLLGEAERTTSRKAVGRALLQAATRRGAFAGHEVLTPVGQDPPSVVPLVAITAELLTRPVAVSRTVASTVRSYAVTPHTLALLGTPRHR